jgi:hypothetical protein
MHSFVGRFLRIVAILTKCSRLDVAVIIFAREIDDVHS